MGRYDPSKEVCARALRIVRETVELYRLDVCVDEEEVCRMAEAIGRLGFVVGGFECWGLHERGYLTAYAYLYSRGFEMRSRGYTRCIRFIKERLGLDEKYLSSALDRVYSSDKLLWGIMAAAVSWLRKRGAEVDPRTAVAAGCRLAYMLAPERYLYLELLTRFTESTGSVYTDQANAVLSANGVKKRGRTVEVPHDLCQELESYGVPCRRPR